MIGICYDMQERLPSNSEERQELLHFIALANNELVCFSSAGFFSLNRSTVLGILSVTATYYIIIIQFQET